ncbi:MAG: hypothetical protein K2M31_08630 [Muribaculaceae bacterium]|nr:hypothetical protein [Muribaculaceae bacterium]
MGRRARFHDYMAPGYYLITATAIEGDFQLRRLSVMPNISPERLKSEGMILPVLTPLGKKIEAEIRALPLYHPLLAIKRYVIMPDHIHFVLHVKERLTRKLGSELAGFFGACTHALRDHAKLPDSDLQLFQPFHDQIIFNFPQLDRSIKYVEDNPRRLIYKRKHPDLFKCRLHVIIGNREYGLMGNIFLLREVYLLPVRIHRRWSIEEFDSYEDECIKSIEQGAVAISPGIHPREKAIMNIAVQMGGYVIKLTDRPLTNRTKPTGKLFDLCIEGRLLLIAPWAARDDKPQKSGYKEFHNMNDMAKEIAEMPAEIRMKILEVIS